CNILLEGSADIYTVRNYGKRVNCSLTTLYPANIKVLSLSVGLASSKTTRLEVETGTKHKNIEVNVIGAMVLSVHQRDPAYGIRSPCPGVIFQFSEYDI
ncbi:unnamed protein product, partial [Timema podura]|nr:unnamed protein product [Timema podura]